MIFKNCSKQALYFPKKRDKLMLENNVSVDHKGVVLKVKEEKNKLVCENNFEKFKPNEITYNTYEKKLLAIKKNGTKRFHIGRLFLCRYVL